MSTPPTLYYGLRIGPGEPGYDGVLRMVFSDTPGADLQYLAATGWVDSPESINDLGDWGTVEIDEATAQHISQQRFGRPLP